MKRQATSMQILLGVVLGIGIGAGVALILGSGGLWLAVGLAIGIAIGAVMARKSQRSYTGESTINSQRPAAHNNFEVKILKQR